ncbi:MAG: hypothetical protein A2233_03205 [Candidatus Kerfeldbacteria bacterium RIFOXYA2_FULL_38_24]|uniref:Nucleotidyl transferase AbiEii/AbiGii toxin family protein n=1 Tax=Candidatus Kerfeldbacteria bacterium RIFOXYB2_FULL_38_14 TaxID=1798547 RepID=A0A1G2BE06_9BACT|nr:MAG: hypothetical protein A2233_03205 [Candidatus Kerfeldbacteria bacterium RIFOXYA2_FULL_38_24]OGY86427.1 MAG: hypothetical protein A2319_01245 [Candidatus Kerfeldbacteria bacterium RIFOXYB2_FULL_38_14]
MINREKHQLMMGRILRDFYNQVTIASWLGFKGGTCAYFFYGLPRFSVDLDFDLLHTANEENKKLIFKTIRKILEKYGEIKDSCIKRYTIFFLLSYGAADHNIKVEINIRLFKPNSGAVFYELKEYLGISMLVATKDYLFISKLVALTARSEVAMRDIYDLWYFASNNWNLNAQELEARTGKKSKEYLAECITVIEQVKDNEILQGLGELLSEKEKTWVKIHLRKEVIFLLKNYQSTLT